MLYVNWVKYMHVRWGCRGIMQEKKHLTFVHSMQRVAEREKGVVMM